MTVIATDGRSMAGDGLSVDVTGTILADVCKVFRLKDGGLVGFAGNPYDMAAFVEWLDAGAQPAAYPEVDDQFQNLILRPDGTCGSYGRRGRWSSDFLPSAIGCGMDLAIGAMEAGRSAIEAVQISCKRHSRCGGSVVMLLLESGG